MVAKLFRHTLLGCIIASFVLGFRSFDSLHTSFRKGGIVPIRNIRTSLTGTDTELGGKVVVTGIGQVEEDEFPLNLLHEQHIWSSVTLVTNNAEQAKKRFLTRTARYSGLLDVLDFASLNTDEFDQLPAVLHGANAWVAINVPETRLASFAAMAIEAKLKRVLFTVQLSEDRITDIVVPTLDDAAKVFAESGIAFTGIRHGNIIPGDEDNAYEIVNATLPLVQGSVERGVLARVVMELLRTGSSYEKICGVSSSNAFAGAYLNILRSTGLTRQQEVEKIFNGGIQRVAQLTAREREAERKREEERLTSEEKRKADELMQQERERSQRTLALTTGAGSSPRRRSSREQEDAALSVDFDTDEGDPAEQLTDETLISIRANEILTNVWMEFNARMISKTTSKSEFYEINMDMATDLATKELQAKRDKEKKMELEREAALQITDEVAELERRQYAKLLSIERREMQNQKQISDTWVRYIYALLEVTCAHCAQDKVRFQDLSVAQQSLLLRAKANELRAQYRLPPYEAIYDPLDASAIVRHISADPVLSAELHLSESAEEVAQRLNSKYSQLLTSVPALRGASQIVELAIETLRRELPPAPPSTSATNPAELSPLQAATLTKKALEGKVKTSRHRDEPLAEEESIV